MKITQAKQSHVAAVTFQVVNRDAVAQATTNVPITKPCFTRLWIKRTTERIILLIAIAAIPPVKASNNFPSGWCTWGAAAEFDKYAPSPGCDWRGNAGNWYNNATAKGWVTTSEAVAAEPNAIIVWTSSSFGHVGVVNQVYLDHITVREMNWGKQVPGATSGWTDKAGIYTNRDLYFSANLSTPSFKFAGFIMPRKTTAYTAEYILNNQAISDMQALNITNGNFGSIVMNTLVVNKAWDRNFQLRTSRFNYWLGTLTVYHATWVRDPKVRFTMYWEPLSKQWIGWQQVQ